MRDDDFAWWITSFIWPPDLRYYVGYRACEFTPKQTDAPLPHPKRQQTIPPPPPDYILQKSADWRSEWLTDYVNLTAPEKTTFRTFVDCSAHLSFYLNSGKQFVEIRYLIESNGVRIWLTVKTWETITGAFVLSQCLRFGNGLLSGFRQTVSAVPFLSEYLMQMSGNANDTLTWLRQDDAWQPFPVPFTRCYHPISP